MKIASNLVMLLLFLLPSLAGGLPQDDVKISVFVTTVKQDGPLQITGFKLPGKLGDPPVLVLQNTTDKPITVFYVSAAIGNPDADSRGEAGPAYYLGSAKLFGPILPESEREAPAPSFRAHHLAHGAGELHSTCLHAAVSVTSVIFADGEVWRAEDRQQEIWKSSLLPDSTKPCEHSAKVEAALKDWDGATGYEGMGSPSHLDTRTVQSYAFTCRLRDLGGKLVAICS